MGLPGSGKSTLVNELAPLLKAVVFNNDAVRRHINHDLGFSLADRIEQATRMGWLCDQVVKAGHCVIADFICPTAVARAAFGPCFTVFMDTVTSSRFPDTDKIFERPAADLVFTQWDSPAKMAAAVHSRLRSSAVEHLHGKQKVVGSSPTAGSTLCTTSLNGSIRTATEAAVPCANLTSITTGIAEHGKTSGPM